MVSCVWQPQHATDKLMNQRQAFLCRCTASMEQAANRAEAAVVDHYFLSPTENIPCSSLPISTGKQTDDCFVMCPQSSSKGYNKNTSVIVTVTADGHIHEPLV